MQWLALVYVDSRERKLTGIESTLEFLDEAGLIKALVQLVQINSVFDPERSDGNERKAADFVGQLLEEWGWDYERWDVVPDRPNIVVDIPGSRPGPLLIFEGHTDVVTAGDLDAWSFDPFAGEIYAGKLYGRGAADMKSGLLAMLFAARALDLAGRDYAGTLRLAILADEEGFMLGAKDFVRRGYLEGAAAAIVCEPEGGRVCVAQKGAIRIRLDIRGKMAHGCMPEEGANPLTALGEVVVACRRFQDTVQAEHKPHELLGKFYVTPTVALAGTAQQANVISSTATLYIDVRTGPEHDHDDILQRLELLIGEAAASVAGVTCELSVLDNRPATETNPGDPVVAAVVTAHTAEFGDRPAFGGVPGSTDGTIFWAASRIPLVTYGPGDTTIPHQVDEFVRVDEVATCARVYARSALNFFMNNESEKL